MKKTRNGFSRRVYLFFCFTLLITHYSLLIVPCFPQEVFESDDYPYDDDALFFENTDGITVTGTVETTQQIKIVEKEAIEKSGAADLATLLQETLDLGVTRYGAYGNQNGVNLRGFDIKRIAFLVDGVPVNAGNDGKFDINQIGIGSIERIEVIYGGSDSKYNVSGALGGVINIITVKKQKPGLKIGAGLSNTGALPGDSRSREGKTDSAHWEDLLDTQNLDFSVMYGGSSFSVSANAFVNRAENHYLFLDYMDYIRRKDNNEVRDMGASFSVVKELPDLTRLIASSNIYHGDKNIPTSGWSGSFGKQADTTFTQNLMLDMPRAFSDSFSTEASLTYNLNRRDYGPPSGAVSAHGQQGLGAINRWSWYLSDGLILRSGIDYLFNYLDSTDMGNRTRHNGGLYLTAEWAPYKTVLVIPSLKAVTDGHTIVPVPKLGFVWKAADSFTLKNNYFRSFKFPDFEELYWNGGGGTGNPNLRPEDGWGADIGATWRWKELLRLESTFFTQWINDSIHWADIGGGVWQPQNVSAAMFFGLDNKISAEIPVSIGPVRSISPSLSYQYLLSRVLGYGYTWASEKSIPYMPAHTIGGSLEAGWDSGSFGISGHWESLRYANTSNLTELPPVFLLNASINQKIGRSLSMNGVLRNILNISYESFDGYPMPALTFTLGMRVLFESE